MLSAVRKFVFNNQCILHLCCLTLSVCLKSVFIILYNNAFNLLNGIDIEAISIDMNLLKSNVHENFSKDMGFIVIIWRCVF